MGCLSLQPSLVILQPETLCNIDCTYCYLPFRKSHNTMSVAVARAVAESIQPWTERHLVSVCWHGGEPLATGRTHLGRLMDCFNGLNVRHEIQTNATLINDAWCDFFTERNIRVGVSIDGYDVDNVSRVDLRGAPAYHRIMRGIRRLADHGHDLSVIAVVSSPSRSRARRLFDFALENGISSLGVNIEEQEGVNTVDNSHNQAEVVEFWSELATAWLEHPEIQVREVSRVLTYVDRVLNKRIVGDAMPKIDPLPTVAHDGTVTLVSPELAGFGSFASGNILNQPLDELIRQGSESAWIREFEHGVSACMKTCQYFDFCGGGHAANRYFEQRRLDITETNYCRNSKIALMKGVLQVADVNSATRTAGT